MKNKLRMISAVMLVILVTLLATGTTFAASDQLEQCRNGSFASPLGCTAAVRWSTGNLGAANSHYREGDFVPFRALLGSLSVGTHTLDIEWDFTESSGEHAYDYLGSFNATEATADACIGSGIASCTGSPSTFAIPTDPSLALAVPAVSQIPGVFSIWGGTITSVTYLSTPGPEGSALQHSLRVTFNATSAGVVVAWGGHIASQNDWGIGDSASAISGSPYHMRLLSLDGAGGNKDRSISAGVVPPIPGLTTQANPSTISLGQSVTDTATYTGVTGNTTVDGTTTFFICGPNAVATACTTGGTQVGAAVTNASNSATSAAFTPTQTGKYCFRAEYTPSATEAFSAINHTNATTECVTVNAAVISIVTTQNPATANEGQTLNDSALLSGGVSPTGTITFRLYPPSDATCTGTPVYTDTVTVSGNGSYATDDGGYSSTQPGIYRWTAVYSGDANNSGATSGCAQEPVTVNSLPSSIDVVKTANPTSLNEPGGTVTFSVSITNTSTYDVVTINTINDNVYGDLTDGLNPLISNSTCAVPQVLDPGENYPCSFDGEVSGNAGAIHINTVTGSGVDDDGQPVSDTDDATVEINDVLPTVTLVKSADPTTLPEPGGDFEFTLEITNTSSETVTIIGLTDSQALSTECLELVGDSLAPGASVECQYTISHTDAGSYDNTATVTVQDDDGNQAEDSDDETVTVTNSTPTVMLDKSALPTTLPEPGGVFTFTLEITNTSSETVTITELTDTQTLSQQCLDLIGDSLAPGASTSCTYTVTHTDAGSYDNTASVTVEDEEGSEAEDSDDETVTVTNTPPTVMLDKSALPTTLPEPGGVFTFTLEITNTSAETVTITELTDTQTLSQQCLDLIGDSLAPGASVECEYTVSHTDAGSYDNTASVTVEDEEGSEAEDSDDETVTVTNTPPTVTLDKSALPTTLPEPGGVFTFTLEITNTSAETVTITELTDSQALSAQCLGLIDDSLAPGASTSCTYTVSHTDAGSYPNTASVTVEDEEGSEAEDSDDETVTVTDVLPTVTLEKTVDVSSLPEPGGAFHFTLTITNTSVETVTITSLTDSNLLSAECVALVGTSLAPGASVECEYTVSHSDAGTYPNTASVTVKDDENNPASDTDSETVTVTDVLPTVTLDKSADPTSLPEPGGVFTFTLTITNTSPETVTITALSDSNGLSAQCLNLVLNTTTLAPGQSISCENTNTHTNAGSYDNTASVTVIDDDDNDATDSDTATVTVTDVLPTVTIDKSVNISTLAEPGGNFTYTLLITNTSVETVTITDLSDTQSGATDFSQCAALDGTALAAGASTSCQYTVNHTDAGVYPNTASVTVEDNDENEASDSDDESVEVTDVLPTVTLVKSATPQTLPEPGGVFTFTLTITNTSVEAVTITELTDTQTLSQQCLDLIGDSLAVGAWVSCSYTVTHTNAGIYNNTANVTVADDEQNEAEDEDSETVTVTNAEPLVTLVKSVDIDTLPEPGGDFTFTLTITNTSSETVTIVSLTDDNTLSQECNDLVGDTLAPGAETSCSYVVTHTNVGVYPNTALVTAQDDEGSIASAQDDESVEVTDVLPTVTLDKSADPTTLPEPGGDFTFTLTITNTSVETVTIIGLGDTNDLSAECTALVGTTLAAGASTSCTYVVAHDNVGSFDNTANVMVSDDEGNIANDSDDETVTVTDVAPTVTLVKEATPTTLPEPGGVFTFTLTITNTSVETVTITALTDTNALSQQCLDLIGTTLAAGASTSCQYNVTHTDAGSYDNTATVTVTDDEDNDASDEDTETVVVTDETPVVIIDKSVVPGTRPEPGGVFTYTLTITNASAETVTITALSDTQSGATDFSQCAALVGTTLAAGASTSCEYTVTHTNAGSYPNTATVTVEDDDENEASDSDDETVTVTDVLPTVTLDKSVVPNTRTEPGGDFDYTLTITNTSVETVTITALTDSYALPAGCTNLIGTTLAPGASVSCTYTMTFTNAGTYDNTASVTVADDEQNEASDTDTATVTVTDAGTSVTIVKTASPSSLPEPGGVFTFTLEITNTSAETVTITALTDTNALSQQCLDLIGTTLASGASVSCTYTVTHTAVGSYDNTATVTVVDDDQNEATDSDDETVTVTDILPSVTIVKTASPSSLPAGGGVFTFTLTITNTSSETVTINNLVDTYTLSAQCLALIGTSLNPGQSVSCTYTVTQTAAGSYTNTATVTVNDDEQNNASDSDDETVVVQPPSTPAECGFGFVLTGEIITGTPRSDFIQGTPRNDIIYGLGGSDEIYGNEGDDCIFGGRGLDNLYGNTGNDIIFGNEGDDYIDAGAGVDLVHGNEDDDLILGGDDPDQLYGDTGSDCIFGQNGDDYINGGDGDDAPLVGGNGSDTIFGGGGHDEIWGDGFPGDPGHPEFPVDVITNPGNDSLYGESGHDVIVGGGGNDTIDAGQGDDQMYGEDGDDTLTGGSLSDYFDGGAGAGDTATDWDINTDDLCVDVEFGCGAPAPIAPIAPVIESTPLPDSDGDGVDDTLDICAGFNDAVDTDGDLTPDGCDSTPNGDSDSDGVDNAADICPTGDDAVDTDGDLTPDGCDSTPNGDSDSDGVDNAADICPTGDDAVDTDGDLIPDGCDTSDDRDLDGDTLTNAQESGLGTDPNLADTDGDGVNDNVDTFPLDNTQI